MGWLVVYIGNGYRVGLVIGGIKHFFTLVTHNNSIFSVLNYRKYTPQPGQSVSLRVNPRTQDLEYYSIFILKKKDSSRIKLTGSSVWSERNGDVYYEVEGQKIIKSHGLDEVDEELPNKQA